MKQLKKLGALALSAALAAGLLLGSAFTLQAKADGESESGVASSTETTTTLDGSKVQLKCDGIATKNLETITDNYGFKVLFAYVNSGTKGQVKFTADTTAAGIPEDAEVKCTWYHYDTKAKQNKVVEGQTETTLSLFGDSQNIEYGSWSCEISVNNQLLTYGPNNSKTMFFFYIQDRHTDLDDYSGLGLTLNTTKYVDPAGNNTTEGKTISNGEPVASLPLGYSGTVTFKLTGLTSHTLDALNWFIYENNEGEVDLGGTETKGDGNDTDTYTLTISNLQKSYHVQAFIQFDNTKWRCANFWLEIGAGVNAQKTSETELTVPYNSSTPTTLNMGVTAASSVGSITDYTWWYRDGNGDGGTLSQHTASITETLTNVKSNRTYTCQARDNYGNVSMVNFSVKVTMDAPSTEATSASSGNAFKATVSGDNNSQTIIIQPASTESVTDGTTVSVATSNLSDSTAKESDTSDEGKKAKNQAIVFVTSKKSSPEIESTTSITTTTTYTGNAELLDFTVTSGESTVDLAGKNTEVRIPWPTSFSSGNSVKLYYINTATSIPERIPVCIVTDNNNKRYIVATMPHFSPFLLVETTVTTTNNTISGKAPASAPSTPSNNNSGYSGFSGFGGGSGSSSGNAANDDNTSSNETPYTPTYSGNNTATQNGTPVTLYRMYNPNSGEHIYTTSKAGADMLTKAGWRNETASATAWKSPVKSACPIYQLYNPNSGFHHYSMTQAEIDMLTKAGWKLEGVAWYGLK